MNPAFTYPTSTITLEPPGKHRNESGCLSKLSSPTTCSGFREMKMGEACRHLLSFHKSGSSRLHQGFRFITSAARHLRKQLLHCQMEKNSRFWPIPIPRKTFTSRKLS